MRKSHLRSIAALTTLTFTTWTFGAAAEQPATGPTRTSTTATTEPATTTTTSPVVREPMVGTERQTWPNRPLLVTGTAVLVASYGASVIVAAASDRESDEKLYYPVVGPWISLSDRDCDVESCDNKGLGTALLIGSGVLQGVGALGMLVSLFVPEKTTESWYSFGNQDFMVTPVAGTGELGAAAIGRF